MAIIRNEIKGREVQAILEKLEFLIADSAAKGVDEGRDMNQRHYHHGEESAYRDVLITLAEYAPARKVVGMVCGCGVCGDHRR